MKAHTKRRICAAAGALFLLLAFGLTGGIELGTVSFPRGAVASGLLVLAFGLCWHKAGILRL